MIKNIGSEHSIFDTKEYQEEVVPFMLMELIRKSLYLLVSDESSFVIGRSSPEYPVWVWTKDNISNGVVSEVCDYCYEHFSCGNRIMIVAKPEISQRIIKRYKDSMNSVDVNIINMESFECLERIPAKNQSVNIVQANEDDVESLAECMKSFEMDCFGEIRYEDDFCDLARKKSKMNVGM